MNLVVEFEQRERFEEGGRRGGERFEENRRGNEWGRGERFNERG
jgi:hypothetical protein